MAKTGDTDEEDLQQYERSYCSCLLCQTPCHTLPGAMAAEDLERITLYAIPEISKAVTKNGSRMKEYNDWIADHFVASQDTVGRPVIRPALQNSGEDEPGSCVFLKGGRCSIHPVAPFECRTFKNCGDSFLDYQRTATRVLNYSRNKASYTMIWNFLSFHGRRAIDFVKSWRMYVREVKVLKESGKWKDEDDDDES